MSSANLEEICLSAGTRSGEKCHVGPDPYVLFGSEKYDRSNETQDGLPVFKYVATLNETEIFKLMIEEGYSEADAKHMVQLALGRIH